MKECKACNKMYNDDENFCMICGKRLQTVEPISNKTVPLKDFISEFESGAGLFGEKISEDFAIELEPADIANESRFSNRNYRNDTDKASSFDILPSDTHDEAKQIITFAHMQKYKNSIAAGLNHFVRLLDNGTVIAAGYNSCEQCDVQYWMNVISVFAGNEHTVALKSDGRVEAVGHNYYGQCGVKEWQDIVSVSAGGWHTVGLKSDGSVVSAGYNRYGQCNVQYWKNITEISAGSVNTVGLKRDGTVVVIGNNNFGQCDVYKWTDIISVASTCDCTVGLKKNGTVVTTGYKYQNNWQDIVAVAAGWQHIVGLKKDGTVVVATAEHDKGQGDTQGWSDIIAVAAGVESTVGLKKDGTIVAVGGGVNEKVIAALNGAIPMFEGVWSTAPTFSNMAKGFIKRLLD